MPANEDVAARSERGAGSRLRALSTRWLLLAWVVTVVAAALVVPVNVGQLRSGAPLIADGSSSERAAEVIEERMPELGGEQIVLAFSSRTLTHDDAAYQQAMSSAAQAVTAVPGAGHVLAVPHHPRQDARHAYLLVGLRGPAEERLTTIPVVGEAARRAVAAGSGGRVTVAVTGPTPVLSELIATDLRDLRFVEAVTVPAALALVVFGLGYAGAAVLVLVAAGVGVVVSAGALAALSWVVPVDTMTLVVATTVSLGLGLDYSLLLMTRYRQSRDEGCAPDEAAARAVSTAGRAVLWCAGAVVVTNAALLTAPLAFIRTLALAAVLATVVTAAVATTLLPLLLPRLDPLLSRGRVRRAGAGSAPWVRWARHLMRRPWPYLIGAVVLLGAVAVPATGLRLGVDLDRASLAHTEAGVALVQMEKDHLANVTLLALPHPPGHGPVDTLELTEALHADPRVTAAIALDNGRDLTVVAVADGIPVDHPAAGALIDDVHQMAVRTLPPGQTVLRGGQSAVIVDLRHATDRAMWQVAVLVLIGAFVLMLVVFRSLLLPLKAIAMNLLSTAAALGLLVEVMGHQVHYGVPLLALTVVFGLSLDYEVFLVHRITELYRKGHICREAVAQGVSSTARPITLAAAVMALVFAGLVTTHRQEIQQLGFLVAVAVLLDATLIRLVVVPALMQLLGHRNWWLPRPLAHLWPNPPAHARALPAPRPGSSAIDTAAPEPSSPREGNTTA
ncbi:MMPL family transporter [Streptomyces sp. NPDC012769]|uniref:MMPL family transporter n=1 Tax=Streptomyces sp. NPDC012769 TaxID=3364848 RepID=UPI0036CD14A0